MKNKLIVLVTALMLLLAGCGSKTSLADWVKTDDMKAAVDQMNSQFASVGMEVAITADGDDVLVYTYTCDKDMYGDLTEEDFETTFGTQVSSLSSQFSTLAPAVKSEIGVELSALRFEFVVDGKVVYSKDITE